MDAPTLTARATPFQTFRIIAEDIKIAHSVFAMPFALLAAFMAMPTSKPYFEGRHGFHVDGVVALNPDWRRFSIQIALVAAAMVCARTVAMLANRLIDARIDRDNPRTAGRAIPSGRLQPSVAVLTLIACASAFMGTCAGFGYFFDNWWPARLGPFVLLWISAYAALKRFTWLCHVYLGSSLALSPFAAAIAINPWSVNDQPALYFLSAMVLCWVAGFDIIYALQDVEVDRAQNLHSIPGRLGVRNAMLIARFLHVSAVACLVSALIIDPRLHFMFGIGIGIVVALLLYEHLTVTKWGTTKIALAFFTLNGVISCVLGALGILDVLF